MFEGAAAQRGNNRMVKLLLAYNSDPNTKRVNDGITPVYVASRRGKTISLELLLKAKGDPNAIQLLNGTTPLYAAQQLDHTDAIKVLLKYDADPTTEAHSTNMATFPLFDAALNGRTNSMRVLLRHKRVDPDQPTLQCTSLHASAERAHLEAAQLLVLYGANMAIQDKRGLTASAIANAGSTAEHPAFAEWCNAVFTETDENDDDAADGMTADLLPSANWSRWRIGVALRMHKDLAWLLKEGRIAPDSNVEGLLAAFAIANAEPGEMPWQLARSFPICKATLKLVTDASFGWKHNTYVHVRVHTDV